MEVELQTPVRKLLAGQVLVQGVHTGVVSDVQEPTRYEPELQLATHAEQVVEPLTEL